jgi:hypothetical protein
MRNRVRRGMQPNIAIFYYLSLSSSFSQCGQVVCASSSPNI